MSPVFRHGRLRLYLLRLLAEEPRHGYEVIRLLRDRFMGIYAPSPGTIYPRLARLEEEGLVTHDEVNGRKVYRITDAGRDELRKRGSELDELEAELTASVNDIVREVREDVRDTVRNLREELTSAAREMRRGEREERDDVREQARAARDAAWAQARAAREQGQRIREQAQEQARAARAEAKEHARQAREQGRQTGEEAKEQARAAREDAMRQAHRLKEEAASIRDEAISRFRAIYDQAVSYERAAGGHQQGPGGSDPWAEGTREGSGQPGHEQRDRDWSGWGSWAGWSEWARWGEWGGHKGGWPGPQDVAALRDLERLAKDFTADLRKAATESGPGTGDVMGILRDIIEEGLGRIKSEIFEKPVPDSESAPEKESAPDPETSRGADSSKSPESSADEETVQDTESTPDGEKAP
jgi:DNA-binding PadR family transcriptional regulator